MWNSEFYTEYFTFFRYPIQQREELRWNNVMYLEYEQHWTFSSNNEGKLRDQSEKDPQNNNQTTSVNAWWKGTLVARQHSLKKEVES